MGEEQIEVARRGPVAVCTLLADRPSEADVDLIAKELRELIASPGVVHVVLDFHRVRWFEANLRGKLVWLYRELEPRGGCLALCHLGEMASHPTMVVFGKIMLIRDTLAEALRAVEALPPSAGTGAGQAPAEQ